jgi:hypothetical protein
VTPRSRAAGYVEAQTNEDLSHPTGSSTHPTPLGTGSVAVTVVDHLLVPPQALFRLSFHDSSTAAGSTYETTAFSLENLTTRQTLLDRQPMAASSPSVAGLVIDFFNDELAFLPSASGWLGRDGSGAEATSLDPSRLDDYQTNWTAQLAVDPTDLAKLTSDEFALLWVDPADSLYEIPRFSSQYPRLKIPVYCLNTTTNAPCDLFVDDLNRSGSLDEADALIMAEKECRFCTHVFRFRASFSVPEGAASIAPQAGNRLLIRQQRPFAEGDYFDFTIRAPHVDAGLAVEELARIAVVPNPYVAAAEWEPQTQITGRGPRQVQFIHLPEVCVIRVFTLRGELVREIRHAGVGGDGAAWWDLKTEAGQEVAYGVYLYHVEAPGIGETTGKFAIVK